MSIWKRRTLATAAVLALGIPALFLGIEAPVTKAKGSLPGSLGWGIVLQTDRVFYPVGGQALVNAALFNHSVDTPIVGTNSVPFCRFRFSLRDSADRPIVSFGACRSPNVTLPLPPGGRFRRQVNLSLTDTAGNPIPPGVYKLVCNGDFEGPSSDGMNFGNPSISASIAFRVE